ncbi:MAG: hypothetical protein WC422_02995 [Candidatus Paceibacterota bacterium]|jgi:orotate phosphoribosyltransferase
MTPFEQQFLNDLYQSGGFYTALNSTGKRVGPLVGYAGTYGEEKLQFVGDVYANCAKMEENISLLRNTICDIKTTVQDYIYASDMAYALSSRNNHHIVWLGAPMGGITTAMLLALNVFQEKTVYGFLEKKVVEFATQTSREKSVLNFGRHTISAGDVVVPVEDVCNNFSTTDKMIKLIFANGGRIPFIFCLINRSGKKSFSFQSEQFGNQVIPIVSIVLANWPEYKQDDPEIKDYIAEPGKLVLNPKQNWDKLMLDMANRK